MCQGRDLNSTPAGELAQGIVSTIGPDEPVETIVDLRGTQQVKRLPVVEGGEVIGVISESDLARNVAEDQIHHFVTMVYGPQLTQPYAEGLGPRGPGPSACHQSGDVAQQFVSELGARTAGVQGSLVAAQHALVREDE